jgi:DNA-binding FrmR family transcriptional regulator
MIENGEPCVDTLTQIAAARGALRGAALALLDEHLRRCLVDVAPATRAVAVDDASAAIARLVRS